MYIKKIEKNKQYIKILAGMTSQAIAKNISNTLSKEVEKQVTPVDVQNNQVDNDYTLVERKKNIKKINLEDFPTPGSVILTKEQEKEIVASNKLSYTKKIQLEPTVTDPRTIAFNHMADKDKMAKALSCTKACRNIQRNPETGKFGVCYRAYCTFAHSMDELQPARCSFDSACRFKHGRIIDWNTRTIAPGSKCKFRHSDETIDQYYARSRMTRPDLPLTNEETRKIPEPTKEQPKEQVEEKPKVPVKEQLKEKVEEKPKEEVKEQPKEKKVSRRSYDSDMSSDSESSDSESSESETEEERRRRLKKERKAHKSKKSSPKNDIQVIRVPTKELAEVALKAAFDRGQFNVQVLIE